MKTSFLIAGLLVTTIAAAQMRPAPTAAAVAPRGAKAVSPVNRFGDATAIDPQFDLLRKQITALKQEQSRQQDQIAHLRACVRELVNANKANRGIRQAGASLNSSPGTLAGSSKLGAPLDASPGVLKGASGIGKPLDDKHGLNDQMGKLAPGPTRVDLSSCN